MRVPGLIAASLIFAGSAATYELPDDFELSPAYDSSTFQEAVGIAFTPDGRHLVVQRAGIIRVVTPGGTVLPTPFIDLSLEVCGVRDLGLLGVAVSPDYETDPWIYLLYTVDPDGDGFDQFRNHFSRLTRYRPSVADPNVADLSTREVLIGATWTEGIPSPHESHSIGTLLFATDGTLILGSGDGASYEFADAGGHDLGSFGPGKSDPIEDIGGFRARSLNSMAGKLLRVDPATGFGLPSNPFWDGDGSHNRSRVWAYGFRNPYRFALRPGSGSDLPIDGDPGTLYVGDVGWSQFEELSIVKTGGANMGWPCREAAFPAPVYPSLTETFTGNENVLCGAPANPESPNPNMPPAYWWHHGNGNLSDPPGWVGYSSTGGTFYTGSSFPSAYHGAYLTADYAAGWIRVVDVDENDDILGWSEFGTGLGGVVGVYVDPATGDLLYVDWFSDEVRRISYTGIVSVAQDPIDAGAPAVTVARNPFQTSTSLAFTLSAAASITMDIHDIAGRQVRKLVDREYARGRHFVVWNGADDDGRTVAPGVYFVRLQQGMNVSTVTRVVRQE